ncbi:glycosyltransferase family 4 protein [Chloroflexus sp.]|uniref:glycosyltransferase family 4 protein n=1 Tax=Chloroflexus sp. TaxID=1904827 RepID=UPI002618CDA0|nr:glycosyltransferase family 1 protein [uncultured Chloroflexus sp.]
MQIIINGSFWLQPAVGIGQYLRNLLPWLHRLAPQHRYVLLLPASAALPEIPFGVEAIPIKIGGPRQLAKVIFEQVAVPVIAARLAGNGQPTVIFVPYFAPPLRARQPVVTTIGDLIPLLLPAYRGSWSVRLYMALARRAALRSAHVLTFSNFSRSALLNYLGLPPERVTVSYLAAGEQFCPPADQAAAQALVMARYGVPSPFIYYVGGLDERKNLQTLLRAFALVRRRHQHVTLAIAGRALGRDARLFPDIDKLIADLDLGPAVRRIDVPVSDGPLLYQACAIFAYPSRYEGFGLPPLEAMACGAPTIVSDASSLPEVVGAAALRIAPDDVAGWATALIRLLEDEALRHDLRARGLARAASFSYRRAAATTLEVLEQVARARAPRPA